MKIDTHTLTPYYPHKPVAHVQLQQFCGARQLRSTTALVAALQHHPPLWCLFACTRGLLAHGLLACLPTYTRPACWSSSLSPDQVPRRRAAVQHGRSTRLLHDGGSTHSAALGTCMRTSSAPPVCAPFIRGRQRHHRNRLMMRTTPMSCALTAPPPHTGPSVFYSRPWLPPPHTHHQYPHPA